MKITRIVAFAILAASGGFVLGESDLQAQTLRSAGPPAEFPPASYKGKQYVDSRGCVYIRAGIDGNVNWVPRVSRSRKQLCGFQPTAITGGGARAAQRGPAPEQITLPAEQRPAQQSAAAAEEAAPAARRPASQPKAQAAAPKIVTTAKPRRTPQTTSARPTPAAKPRRVVKVAPVPAQPARPAPAAKPVEVLTAPAASNGACQGASVLSQRYINRTGVRCGPQAEAPVTYRDGSGIGPQSSLILTPNTRVVPVHVYQERRHSQDLQPPAGYRAAWADDRLNLRRAERDLRPAILSNQTHIPEGYTAAFQADGRMNPLRGRRTPEGDLQMAQIWADGTPRTLVELPLDRQVVRGDGGRHKEYNGTRIVHPLHVQITFRSEPGAEVPAAAAPRRYIRAATVADPGKAQQLADRLAASGMPARLGTVSRGGKPYKVVLSGPYQSLAEAEKALSKVRAAGFTKARISR
ncbi:hypothetical protein RSK20926_17182 [Roseobacter sp. SK209-2-6]|uniref:SPOR domain-containing protein n=1 Tax=Roseobacter sp. SK209-2-6 TaxID=388739 RepID=UPI0000F3BF42|nr:SPOR domain-containing protein [Roseobacter sp. SK209-2-6]EBA14951.1 hypothetical protein RSK20926_17182 [Roseobacter sp. SK209-2-6]